jgi:hypothetical protein
LRYDVVLSTLSYMLTRAEFLTLLMRLLHILISLWFIP